MKVSTYPPHLPLEISEQFMNVAVVKIGGALLKHPDHLERVLAAVGELATKRPVVVVPGGGLFADVVRDVDKRVGLSDATAHWMAVLAMDQYALLLVERLRGAVLVRDSAEITAALTGSRVPVLAPANWMRTVDPLPHSWDVTSDSIAAWIAGVLGARDLLLIKAPAAEGASIVDAYFARALPSDVRATVVTADRLDQVESALGGEQSDL
jgi:aspartokinase-like uncharacterized kinase